MKRNMPKDTAPTTSNTTTDWIRRRIRNASIWVFSTQKDKKPGGKKPPDLFGSDQFQFSAKYFTRA